MQNTNISKYPEECASIKRQQTLSITPKFVLAKSSEGEDPAKVHNGNFSRVDITLIDKDKSFVNSTIKFVSIPGIMAASQYAYTKHMDAVYAPQKATGGSQNPAFQMKFFSGTLKGQTIAQVALEQGEDVLKKQFEWLKQNVEKFPKNKQLMDAINETVKALREGKLSADDATPAAASCITIYDAMKGNPHKPLKQGSNLFFVHDLKIKYFLGDNYPVHVIIKNYYAPLNKEENGQQKIDFSGRDKSTENEVTMKLSADEWSYILYQIKASEDRFERLHDVEIDKDIKASIDKNKKSGAHPEQTPAQTSAPKKEPEPQKGQEPQKEQVSPAKTAIETPVTIKLKTTVPMTQSKSGTNLFLQGVTESGEKKNILFTSEGISKVDENTWSKFLNKTKTEGCTFTGKFAVSGKGTLVFMGF